MICDKQKQIKVVLACILLLQLSVTQVSAWTTAISQRPVMCPRARQTQRQIIPRLPLGLTHFRPSHLICLSSTHTDQEGPPMNGKSDTHTKPKRRRRGPIRRRSIRAAAETQEVIQEAKRRNEVASNHPTLLSETSFDVQPLHPDTKRALVEVLRLERMTRIQEQTFNLIRSGGDVLARSKTGTGKTLAFLVPIVERLADSSSFSIMRGINVLIVAPTRELAIQIADQADALLTFHDQLSVHCMYGGTKMQRDVNRFNRRQTPNILVATPGRLLDHLKGKTRIQRRLFKDVLQSETNILVYDEVDRLLSGFPKEMKQILSYIPRRDKRQTLLFSATLPKKAINQAKESMLSESYEFVDCAQSDDSVNAPSASGPLAATEVNAGVEQSYVVLPSMDMYISALIALVHDAMQQDPNAKVVVFFPTARLVRFFAQVLADVGAIELHSRLSQGTRNKARSKFTDAKTGILLTSDVSARGVDYPDVSLVIQYGTPLDSNLYIHRLGRTARAGRQGKGLLVVLPFEEGKKGTKTIIRKMGLSVDQSASKLLQSLMTQGSEAEAVENIRRLVQSGNAIHTANLEAAYVSFIAHYAEYADQSVQSDTIVDAAEVFSHSAGLSKFPSLPPTLSKRMTER